MTEPASPADAPSPPLAERVGQGLEQGARAAWRGLAERRGLRVALAGGVVLLVALQLGGGSALSVPLLVVGLVMVVAGSTGPRLRGRFALEFGPDGTSLSLQTHIAPPGTVATASPALPTPVERPRFALVPSGVDAPPIPDDPTVVEGHGETIEMDVAQLRELLAAERTA